MAERTNPSTESRKAAELALAIVALAIAGCINEPSRPASTAARLPAVVVARVTVASPRGLYPRNRQSEPALAADAHQPSILVVGANDDVDHAACTNEQCRSVAGVGSSGVYFSFDGGRSWTQPAYSGWTGRGGRGHVGRIGTLPWYFEKGLQTLGDPSVAFGPRPTAAGFSWAKGSRLYYANLAVNFPGKNTLAAASAVAVSRSDSPRAAAHGRKRAWKRPVIASHYTTPKLFEDKPTIWADNASSSRFFGHVYVCWTSFQGRAVTSPAPIVVARSVDGGATWSRPVRVSPVTHSTILLGVSGCTVRTDSRGVVYVFWSDIERKHTTQFMARSRDGARTFERQRVIARTSRLGRIDPSRKSETFDGVDGARTASFPLVDIANGAPSGRDATDEIAMVWADGRRGLDQERALVRYSTSHGTSWSRPVDAAAHGDRPDLPAIAISPDGRTVYVTYEGFRSRWQHKLSKARLFRGVFRRAAVTTSGSLAKFETLYRGPMGDARASQLPAKPAEFLGDYNSAVATRTSGVAVWTDARNALVCPAFDHWRKQMLVGRDRPPPPVSRVCPPSFGNTDVFSAVAARRSS
jgi:hypothetical protein